MNDANPRRHYAEGGQDNERDPYPQDPYYQQQRYDYDEYGRPVPPPPAPPQQGYAQPPYQDPSSTYGGGRPQGYDIPQQAAPPYYEQFDTGQHPVHPPQGYQQDYGTGQQPVYRTGQIPTYETGQIPTYETGQIPTYETGQIPTYETGQIPTYETGQIPTYDTGQQAAYQTGQMPAYDTGQQPAYETGQQPVYQGEQPPAAEQQTARDDGTDQFAFVDEESEESEEVIDWLKFSESRTERREEAKRRGRKRTSGLVVILVLALLGGAGYLWQAGKIPGLKKNSTAAAATGGDQRRDVIVVHMLPVNGGASSTALLVDNTTKKHGTTVLIPGSVQLTDDDGSATTLDKSVANGVGPTRDSLNTLLGTDIKGSWRLDSPYLELLVDSLGDVFVDTNTEIKGTGKDKDKVLVPKGEQQDLNGQAAVTYATYKGPGESQTDQLARFGQVMQAVLKKMPSDAPDATKTVQALAQILDPSLTEKQLGASLAELADLAKTGQYSTTMLPVQKDGTLDTKATDSIVKDVLGGSVKQSTGSSAAARVSVKDASGNSKSATMAQAAIVNGGTYTYVAGGKSTTTQAVSQVLYTDPARAAAAKDVAATLGLPTSAVKKGTVPSNADISVVLGKDYKPSTSGD
ncbi:transcriptional attenuator, LytR family [Actinacidiphila yanglinensis]|uniref:Transcriptional attenuator, LytR family n=1 Tax=Actinacidiphila yanglinensis TaxID=310779 RepID=A0A1H6DM75_9ACTN|nr:LCP family protein [Actinacidiphila yanglinensis]SEG86308.1 transcriptional attenuator, LytR family [Actinacidiphila yanglinensis]